jgi:hypothetical protein
MTKERLVMFGQAYKYLSSVCQHFLVLIKLTKHKWAIGEGIKVKKEKAGIKERKEKAVKGHLQFA